VRSPSIGISASRDSRSSLESASSRQQHVVAQLSRPNGPEFRNRRVATVLIGPRKVLIEAIELFSGPVRVVRQRPRAGGVGDLHQARRG